MGTSRHSFRLRVLSLVGAMLAAAAMLSVSPVQNRLPAFLLWTVFFGVLLAPRRRCSRAARS